MAWWAEGNTIVSCLYSQRQHLGARIFYVIYMYCVLHTAVYTPCDTWLGGTPVSTVHWTIIVGGGCSWLFTSRHALSNSIILGLYGSAQPVQDRQVLRITLSKSLIWESGMPFYMLLLFGRLFMACWDQQHGRLIQNLCVNVNEVTIVTILLIGLLTWRWHVSALYSGRILLLTWCPGDLDSSDDVAKQEPTTASNHPHKVPLTCSNWWRIFLQMEQPLKRFRCMGTCLDLIGW